MRHKQTIAIIFATLLFASTSQATDEYSIRVDPATNSRYFIFNSPKGNVRFNHDLHQMNMKTETCLVCHNTKTPTKGHTMSRFDKQTAHSFCRGCHQKNGRGPAVCVDCHKKKK